MKALVKTALGAGNLEVIDREEPKINEEQVKIKVKYAGICGSDLHTFEGNYKVTAPVTLGHEFAGEVTEVGANVKKIKVGDRVTSETTFEICGSCRYCKEKKYNLCSTRKGIGTQQDGAFTKYVIARKESVHLLPEKVTYLDASITEAAACAYHGVDKAEIKKDDIVLVLGPGPIGLLVAQIVKAKGGKVVMTGLTKDVKRLEEAKTLGINYTIDVQTENPKEVIDKLTDGYGADVCFDCTGAVPSMQMGMDLLRKQGQYVQVGIFPKDEVLVDFSKIIQKELVLTGSRSQNTHDWEPTLALMNNRAIQASTMITHTMKIDEWDKAYQLLKNGEAIKIALEPID
jgi:L-iditol 2-dehydrogenase